MANEKLISAMQMIVDELSQQADGHMIQSHVFGSQGFSKLAEKYAEHAEEERGFVAKFIDRILDLGAVPKLGDKKAAETIMDPVEWLEYDHKVSVYGLNALKEIMKICGDDVTSHEILKEYYMDEEEDMYWAEEQLDLIEMIGKQNWLFKQL